MPKIVVLLYSKEIINQLLATCVESKLINWIITEARNFLNKIEIS